MLKQLMIAKKLETARSALTALLEEEQTLTTRGEELEAAIAEAETDEELGVVEENITELEGEQAELAEKKGKLEGEIAALEGELEELKGKEPKNVPVKEPFRAQTQGGEARMRNKPFNGLTRESMETLVAREEVKEFLARTREFGAQKRGVTGADLLIPDVMLGLLRDNLSETSKLLPKVN